MDKEKWQMVFSEASNLLGKAPLVHCITNEITNELVANGLLFVGAKPIMTEYLREFPTLFETTDSLLLNMGKLTPDKEMALIEASRWAGNKPIVLDIVGAAATPLRYKLARQLAEDHPTVLKGNISEMRAFCGLETKSRGVDGTCVDQEAARLFELSEALQQQDPTITYLTTGVKDVIVQNKTVYFMENGVSELDCFTGTGDLVGALIAAALGTGMAALSATIFGVSYLNLAGEKARENCLPEVGLADFRHETMNQLSLLHKQTDWWKNIKGREQ